MKRVFLILTLLVLFAAPAVFAQPVARPVALDDCHDCAQAAWDSAAPVYQQCIANCHTCFNECHQAALGTACRYAVEHCSLCYESLIICLMR